jgi:hypothetical protein
MRLPPMALLAAMVATPSLAGEFDAAMQAFLDTEISAWSQSSEIVEAIHGQNAENAGLDQAQIDALDLAWRGEIGTSATPTIDPSCRAWRRTSCAAGWMRQAAASPRSSSWTATA